MAYVSLHAVRRLPPLVTPSEVDALRRGLAEVAAGKRFLLQGGDCAERFMDCADEPIEKKLKILLQMSLVLTWGARIPTLRIARMAGQFSKPRTKETEVVNGVEMAAFRGDNINSFDTSARTPDPARLVAGYFHSAATLNYARALLAGGLADLHSASHWDLGFVQVSYCCLQPCVRYTHASTGVVHCRFMVQNSLGRPSKWCLPEAHASTDRPPLLLPLSLSVCRMRRTATSTRRWCSASCPRWTSCAYAAWKARRP